MCPVLDDNLVSERIRLTRRLCFRAAASLLTLFVLALMAGVLGLLLLIETWAMLNDRRWFNALGFSLSGVFLFGITWRLSGCLLTSSAPPSGMALSPGVAPSLHALIRHFGERFDGVRIDGVWITGEMNAAVLQRPRWGLVGPLETHLLIGLPLVHSVSERQFGAVLAHEFGHLACQRRSLAAWGCHLRAAWFRTADCCVERMPYFGALIDRMTFSSVLEAQALARLEEFEADRAAAEIVGSGLVAETLVEMAAREQFLLQDYWVKVMAQCGRSRRPSLRPYRDMGLGMVAGFLPSERRDVEGDEGAGDGLHPTLAERLEALSESPGLEMRVEDSVAERHLAPLLPQLAWELDRRWWALARWEWRANRVRKRRVMRNGG